MPESHRAQCWGLSWFAAYVSPVGELIASFGINYHQFADDLQMYVGLVATNAASTMSQLAACTAAVRHWFLLNGLQLNASKPEGTMRGTAVETAVRTVDIAGTSLPLIEELNTLGVIFDSHLRFDEHAAAVIRAYNCHLRALRHIRNALPDDVAKCIGCSIVGAKLDYCNSLLYGSPVSTLDKLQRVQNQLARIVTKSDWQADANACLFYESCIGCLSGKGSFSNWYVQSSCNRDARISRFIAATMRHLPHSEVINGAATICTTDTN